MKIIADSYIPFLQGVLEKYSDIEYLAPNEINSGGIQDADAMLIRTRTQCNESLLRKSEVKFIGTATIGKDHIDTDYCTSNNIQVVSAPGCNADSVLHYLASALFEFSEQKKIPLKGLCVGIIGVGHIGSKVKNLCEALGMKVLCNDPPRAITESDFVSYSLFEIAQNADIITLHLPLNRKSEYHSFHLIDKYFLAEMKSNALFINTSRGEIVDTDALKDHLQNNPDFSVILDVYENEPNPDLELVSGCMIATPHIAGYSVDGKANGTAAVINSLSQFFNLGIHPWKPAKLPALLDKNVKIDLPNPQPEQLLRHFLQHTYPIMADDRRFKQSPLTFEKQRETYPPRRDCSFYHIQLSDYSENVRMVLDSLGIRYD